MARRCRTARRPLARSQIAHWPIYAITYVPLSLIAFIARCDTQCTHTLQFSHEQLFLSLILNAILIITPNCSTYALNFLLKVNFIIFMTFHPIVRLYVFSWWKVVEYTLPTPHAVLKLSKMHN